MDLPPAGPPRKPLSSITCIPSLQNPDLSAGDFEHGSVSGQIDVIDIAERKSTTVELKITYLRPVTSHKVTARSHLLRTGKDALCDARERI